MSKILISEIVLLKESADNADKELQKALKVGNIENICEVHYNNNNTRKKKIKIK